MKKMCAECGTEFRPHHSLVRFCTSQCRNRAHVRARPPRVDRRKFQEERECVRCYKKFTVRADSEQDFCTPEVSCRMVFDYV